ncbi:hypothetical protein E2C01_034147 [Portunus trituberculatus]|uniref:Uncharacterized protein n=1 Tax=Portunus trituberculatus TaxID=210409 RepID=A0A5B7F4Q0_PORTR|nr:hypothetical protein [Portunus trituberculatus]
MYSFTLSLYFYRNILYFPCIVLLFIMFLHSVSAKKFLNFFQNLLLHNLISLFLVIFSILSHPPPAFPAVVSHDHFFPLD